MKHTLLIRALDNGPTSHASHMGWGERAVGGGGGGGGVGHFS